jgi:hypothetical protein
MVQVGDVFVPAVGEDESQAIRVVGVRAAGGLVDCAKVSNGVTFDVAEHMLLDPLKWKPAGYMGSRSSVAAPVTIPPLARRLGDGLRELADMLDERERLYGPAIASWERIARLAGVTTEQALGVLIAMKRERALFSPSNPDHLRDEQGYLAILAEVRRAAAP